MSQWTSARAHPANMTRHTWLNDQLFSMIPGVAHTIFNPGMFAYNFLTVMDIAAQLGIFPYLSGDGRAAPVSDEDMGKTAAALLIDGPKKHAGKRYRPTGPQLLNAKEMAAIVAKVVGHRVLPVAVPIWLLSKVASQRGIDPYQISVLRFYLEDMKKGTFAIEGGVTNVVEELTGTPAESFESTARRYAALPEARQTLGNRLKAFANFNLTPFYRGYNFDKWDRKMGFPVPPNPSLSFDDPHWQAEHRAQMLGTPKFQVVPIQAAE